MRKNYCRILFIFLFSINSIIGYTQTKLNWAILDTPFRLSYSIEDGLELSLTTGINTRFGRFSVDHTLELNKKLKTNNITIFGNIVIKKQDLVVVIRDLKKI